MGLYEDVRAYVKEHELDDLFSLEDDVIGCGEAGAASEISSEDAERQAVVRGELGLECE